MTDQDRGFRFPDGDPIGPIARPRSNMLLRVGTIFIAWAMLFVLLVGVFYMLKGLIASARADEGRDAALAAEAPRDPSLAIFEKPGECFIDIDLHVTGAKREACVERLETAARLAKAEMRVNAARRRK